MSRSAQPPDKLRSAISVLNSARESMLDHLADSVLEMADEFAEGGFQVNEFLELNGSRLHFLCLLIGQFELLSEARSLEASTREKAKEKPKERRPRRREGPKPPVGGEEPPASPPSGEASNDA